MLCNSLVVNRKVDNILSVGKRRSCSKKKTGTHAYKKRLALIMLITALQFDVSTSCNEKTEINKMNKNCIVCVYTVSLSQLRNH